MRITFIGHASLLIEAGGITVLSDPWWNGPCFGAQWWSYPAADLGSLAGKRIDYIYISHGHHDHFHPGTLRTLSRDARILVARRIGLAPHARALGFEVLEVDEEAPFALGNHGVTCRILPTHGDDTLMALSDGKEVCLNLNDALHSAPEPVQRRFAALLTQAYPAIDYMFCGYGVASHFPNCYIVPGKDREATAARRQHYFNTQWAKLVSMFRPRFAFPFAADVVFLEQDLFWANEPTHNTERPTECFRALYPDSSIQMADIAPGFVIERGEVVRRVTRSPVRAEDLRGACAAQIERANRYGAADEAGVREVATLVERSIQDCSEYLRSYEGDYAFLIRFRNNDLGIEIAKRGSQLSCEVVPIKTDAYDIIYTTRLAYLKWSFTQPHGHELLFVGSGGVFEYADAARARENLHRELMQILRTHDTPPQPRPRPSSKLVFTTKQALKSLIGRRETDLYDLGTWTVFNNGGFENLARAAR
jgi:hypothetical protein